MEKETEAQEGEITDPTLHESGRTRIQTHTRCLQTLCSSALCILKNFYETINQLNEK